MFNIHMYTRRNVHSGLSLFKMAVLKPKVLNLTVWSLSVLLSAGCQTRAERTQLERGRAAFARICSSCHGFDGKGGLRAGFNPPPRDLTDTAFQDSITDEQILATLRNGKGQMPAFAGLLPEEEQRELLAFVRSLKSKARQANP
jgi:cytochrome c6